MENEKQFDPQVHKKIPPEQGGSFVDKTALDLEQAQNEAAEIYQEARKESNKKPRRSWFREEPDRNDYFNAEVAVRRKRKIDEYERTLKEKGGQGLFMPEVVRPEDLLPNFKKSDRKEPIAEEGLEYSLDYSYPYRNWVSRGLEEYKKGYDAFLQEFTDADEEKQKELIKKFPGLYSLTLLKDRVVVDLASGAGKELRIYILANVAGAAGYIAVDKNEDAIEELGVRARFGEWYEQEKGKDEGELRKNKLQEINKDYGVKREKAIPISLVNEDMLTFVKKLPDNSVSFVMSGVDFNIMSDFDYMGKVEEEVRRSLHPDGGYIAVVSEFNPRGGGVEEIVKGDAAGPIEVFKKTSPKEKSL